MKTISFIRLLIVTRVTVAAPIAGSALTWFRAPALVLEILDAIVVGASGGMPRYQTPTELFRVASLSGTWRDIVWARALLRASLSTIGRLTSRPGAFLFHGELMLVLTETSYAAHRALIRLSEAQGLLAEPARDLVSRPEARYPAEEHTQCGS